MMERVEQRLVQLPEPAPASSFAPTVMARIARLSDRSLPPSSAPARSRPERLAPLWVMAGILIVVLVTANGLAEGGSLSTAPGVTGMILGVGLWLFLHGLFAPLRRK